MEFWEQKYLKYKKKYYDLKGGAHYILKNGDTVTVQCAEPVALPAVAP